MDIGELFPAGPVLDEEHQVGRVGSIEGLADRLRAGDVVRVFDRRRWGKSSVARAALKRLDTEGLITARVALDEYPTPAAAAAVLAEAFAARTQRVARTRARSAARSERSCPQAEKRPAARTRWPLASCSKDCDPRSSPCSGCWQLSLRP